MKRFLFTICLVAYSAGVFAQTFACQYIDAIGFDSRNSGWQRRTFPPEKPFYLKVEAGEIDQEKLSEQVFGFSLNVKCVKTQLHFPSPLTVFSCTDSLGSMLSWSPDSLNGATSKTLGGAQRSSDNIKDSVLVRLFSCKSI